MQRRPLWQASVLAAAFGLTAAGCGAASGTAKQTTVKLSSFAVKGYGSVLGNGSDHSVYLLEKNGSALPCTGTCNSLWPPVLVPKGTKLQGASALSGTFSLKARGQKDQVLYNGWPLYTYAGDHSAKEAHGQNIQSFGGTWHLVRASASSKASTPVASSSSSSSSSGSGGSGW